MTDCNCGQDGSWTACIQGDIYGPCENEHCTGICEYESKCVCPCHATPAAEHQARLAAEPKETP